jgi:hypothetical protein
MYLNTLLHFKVGGLFEGSKGEMVIRVINKPQMRVRYSMNQNTDY